MEFGPFDVDGGHLGVGDDNAPWVLAGVELAAHGETGSTLRRLKAFYLGRPLNDILRRADYLVIAMPATAATKGAIDRRALALMKPSAFLINIARRDRR